MRRKRWKVGEGVKRGESSERLEKTVSAATRVDARELSVWCEYLMQQGVMVRSVSAAISMALSGMVEWLKMQGRVGEELPSLREAIEWLEEEGLMQRRMHGASGKKLVAALAFESARDSMADPAELGPEMYRRMHSRDESAVDTQRYFGDEVSVGAGVMSLASGMAPKRKVKMPDHSFMKKWSNEERDAMREKFELLPEELKEAIGDDKQVQQFPEGLFITPREETKKWYHEEFEPCDDSIEWSENVQTFALFATSMLKSWKAYQALKEYEGEDGVINPPDVYFKEQAQVLAEHERFKAEQEALRAEQERQTEMEKSKVKADKEIERLKRKMEEAEKKAREMQTALRGSGGMPVV